MLFIALWRSFRRMSFIDKAYPEAHLLFDRMTGLIKDRLTQLWVVFKAGDTE
jgi:hypothetical protein